MRGKKNIQKRQLLKQNNLRPDGEAEGLGTGKRRYAAYRSLGLSSPWAPAAGWGEQCAGPGPQGAAGRPPRGISLCHSFSYLGTKGPNFLLQMCSSMSDTGGTRGTSFLPPGCSPNSLERFYEKYKKKVKKKTQKPQKKTHKKRKNNA